MDRALAKRASAWLVALALAGLAGAVHAQAAKPDAAKGQTIAGQVCVACHASDGNSVAPANPKIAGQIPEYLHKQLANFKPQGGNKAERENAVMSGMVASLSDADMRNLAAYYAGQKLKPAAARSKDLAAAGQKLYRGGNSAKGVPACSGCHGPDGSGMPSQYPRIAGQYAEYIEAQLKLFKSGERANDPNRMMRGVAERMSEKDIKAVAEYVAGLR
jgi:cytochrome c553